MCFCIKISVFQVPRDGSVFSFYLCVSNENHSFGLNLRVGWGLAVLSCSVCHVGAPRGVDRVHLAQIELNMSRV